MLTELRARAGLRDIGIAVAAVAALTLFPAELAAQSPSVTATPATVASGGTITVTVANGPGSPTDWVAVAATSAPDTTYLDWKYLNNSTIPPGTGLTSATLQLVAPMAAGTYEVRFFANFGFTRLATSGPITVQGMPTLSINNVSATEGNSGTTPATFTVTLSATSTQTVTVAYATANGTATAGSDYVAASGTLTFAPGTATRTLAVLVNGDTTVEPDENFSVTLSSPTNAGLGTASGVATILTDEAPPSPTVTATPTTVAPGGTVTVTVSNGPGSPTDWVAVAATGAPDTSYLDWKYLNGSTIPPGTGLTSATLQLVVPTTSGAYEVRFMANSGFTRLATSGTVTVTGLSTLSINDVSVTEGNSGTTSATFTVTLSPTSAQTVTVAYATANGTATAGSDYVAASGTLTFTPGAATRTVAVLVNGDTAVEPNETFSVMLSSPTNASVGDASGVATILNDDTAGTPTIAVTPTTVAPGGTVTVTVANGPGNVADWVALYPVSAPEPSYLDWKYLNGLQTVPPVGLTAATLTFTMPTTPGAYNVRFLENSTFTLLATSATVTVQALPTLSINDASVTEGNSGTTPATFTVTLSPTSAQTVTVAYATANGTATAGSDYVAASGTLTFTPGTATQTLAVLVNGDTTLEPNETFSVALSSPTNAGLNDASGAGTILNDEVLPTPTIVVTPTSVAPGGTVTVTVANGPGNVADWVALYPTGAAEPAYLDWQYLNGLKTLPPAGVTTATLTFTMPASAGTYNFRFLEKSTFTVLATSATVTVQSLPALTINDASVTEGNSGTASATFTVTLSPTSTNTVTVNYATANGTATAGSDYVAASGTLTFTPGAATQTLAVVVNGDTTVEPNETFSVTLSSPANAGLGDASGAGTILNDDAPPSPTIAATPTSVAPGGTVTVTVANGPGNPADWVALYPAGASDPGYIDWKYLNGLRTVPSPGLTAATVTFTMPATPGPYQLRFFANNDFALLATSATVTVQAQPTLTINTASVTEGNSGTVSATFTVTLSPTSTNTVTVNYATANGTATAGSDYVAASGTLTFTPGASTRTVSVLVNGDTTVEPNETFSVTLSGPTNAGLGNASGVATILNDDAPLTPTITAAPTTVVSGGTLTVTVANGPANVGDWVALYPAGAADPAYTDWKYLNGLRTLPAVGVTAATLTFTAPTTLGSYQLRFFANNDFNLLASANFTVAGDTTAPVISSVTSSAITISGATITWSTDEASDSQVDYGPTTAYGSSSALNTTKVTAHSVALSGMTANTTYHYRVRSRDAAGNLALSGDFMFTTLAGDITPPTVSISAPSGGSTVTGVATVSANASDNVGVVGVQFRLDGAPLGAEEMASPYSISWDTAGSSDLVFGVTKVIVAPIVISAGSGFGTRLRLGCPGCTSQDMISEDKLQVAAGSTAATFTFSTAARYLAQMAAFKTTTTPAYVQGGTAATNSGSSTIAQTFGANVAVGNLLVVAVAWQGSGSLNVTDNRANVYAVATSAFDTVNGQTLAILYAANAAGGPTTVTATFGGTAPTIQRLAIHEYSGIATASPLDVTATNIADGTTAVNTITSGSVTTNVIAPVSNGSHTLTALARDAAGNSTTSAAVSVTVANGDVTPPVISGVTAASITASAATINWTTNEASDTQVDYGLTTAYGSTSPLNGGLVTAHSAILGALTGNTTYHFRARSRDAAGNLALSGDFTFTTLAVDLTPPVVSITAPAANATVSGTIPFSATATDNVGVVGVEFKLDGVLIAPEDTLAPYSLSWDTTTASQGIHTLTAVAWDAAGNQATATRTVTVSNPLVQVILAWDANTEPDLAGYKVYVGTASGVYSVNVINVGNVTTNTVTGLTPGTVYYFAVTAYNTGGFESDFSNEVSK